MTNSIPINDPISDRDKAVQEVKDFFAEYDGGLTQQALSRHLQHINDTQQALTSQHLSWRKILSWAWIILFFLNVIYLIAFELYFIHNYSVEIAKLLVIVHTVISCALASIIIGFYVRFPDISTKIFHQMHQPKRIKN